MVVLTVNTGTSWVQLAVCEGAAAGSMRAGGRVRHRRAARRHAVCQTTFLPAASQRS